MLSDFAGFLIFLLICVCQNDLLIVLYICSLSLLQFKFTFQTVPLCKSSIVIII